MQVERITSGPALEYWEDYAKQQQLLTSIPTKQERLFMEQDPDIAPVLENGGTIAITTLAGQGVDGTTVTVISRWIFIKDKDENLKTVLIWHWY
jgi:hypothetical protein